VPAVSLIVFLALPTMHTTLSKRFSEQQQSYVVAETLMISLVIGDALIVAASSMQLLIVGKVKHFTSDPGLFQVALVVFAVGDGVRAPLLAVASSYIDSGQETARLYTLLSVTDAFAHTVGDPLLQTIWGHALKLGGQWLVLPFVTTLVR
jgi:hypothetical protein